MNHISGLNKIYVDILIQNKDVYVSLCKIKTFRCTYNVIITQILFSLKYVLFKVSSCFKNGTKKNISF